MPQTSRGNTELAVNNSDHSTLSFSVSSNGAKFISDLPPIARTELNHYYHLLFVCLALYETHQE